MTVVLDYEGDLGGGRSLPSAVIPASKRIRRGWILELAVMAGLYFLYDTARDWVTGTRAEAFANAKGMMHLEEMLGIDFELAFQKFVLHSPPVVSFWNIYYGTVHFVLPLAAMVWLYRRYPARYWRWRTAFLVLLALGVLGFWLYPLMPPRLMPASYGYVDTPSAYYNFGPQRSAAYGADGEPTEATMQEFGNLYSGLPSLHVGWSAWAVCALYPVVRRRWVRALLLLDVFGTAMAIYVTGNHRVFDAIAGWVALGIALAVATALGRVISWQRARRSQLVPAVAPV